MAGPEIMHGNIRLTLSDEQVIAGVKRTQSAVRRGIKDISRQKAIIKIEADIKDAQEKARQYERHIKRLKGLHAEGKLGLNDEQFQNTLAKVQRKLTVMQGRSATLEIKLSGERTALAKIEALAKARERHIKLTDQAAVAAEREARTVERAMERQTQATIEHQREVAKLRTEYDKANQSLQKLQQSGRVKRAVSPEVRARAEINMARFEGQMAVIRAQLASLGEEPIDLDVNLNRSKIMEQLAGIGDIGMRLGPFTGTLGQFSKAALILGPILTGLVGTAGALAGVIGTGLTGALGLAGAGLLGFGAVFGGVFAAVKPLAGEIDKIQKASEAYDKAVREYGKGSEQAAKKLKILNNVTAYMSDEARAGVTQIDSLGAAWGKLTNPTRVAAMEALGIGVNSLVMSMPMLARNTNRASKELGSALQEWARGMSSVEGQGIIDRLMDNTTRSIGPLMDALGNIGEALARVGVSISRYFAPLAYEFRQWSYSLELATEDTVSLDRGVDGMMGTFRSLLSVLMASGRVLREFAEAANGPGGSLLEDMAGGLNDLAASMDRSTSLRDFFQESIDTTTRLFNVLTPLFQLFLEFSTILRPMTNAMLDVAGAAASLAQEFAAFGPIRGLLQAMATIWLLRRGTAATVGLLAGAVNGLVTALKALGAVRVGAALAGVAGGTRAAQAATLAASARGAAPVVAGRGAAGAVGARVAPAAAGGAAAAAARSTGTLARLGVVASGLTGALLGVSAPVAAIGAAAVGAVIGLKKLKDASDRRDAQDAFIKRETGVTVDRGDTANLGNVGFRGAGGGVGPDTGMTNEQIAALERLGKSIVWVNELTRRSGQTQSEMVSVFSNLQNAQLTVEQTERQYAQTVKDTGKNSLESRVALQQLRDARRAEIQAGKEWAAVSRDAGATVERAVRAAQEAWDSGLGNRNKIREELLQARDSATAFKLNLERAKVGLDNFTGKGSEAIGRFARKWDEIPNVKKLLVQVEDQQVAEKIASVSSKLAAVGKSATVAKILADAKNPNEALSRLEARFVAYENRSPQAKLRASKEDAEKKLSDVNKELSNYGSRKPQALLRAKDEAQAKLDSLNSQLDELDGKEAKVGVKIKFEFQDLGLNPNGDVRGPRAGDGWGVPNVKGAVKRAAESKKDMLSQMFMAQGGGLGSGKVSGSGLNAFNGLAAKFGVQVGSGFRPGSITSSGNKSYHSMGRARDFPGPAGAMMAFARFLAASFGSSLKELIYTPLGFSIKNGARVAPYAQADHYDHVHVAMAQGGKTPRQGRYTQPTVLFAEEPNRPEYFISTNPRDRKRSRSLILDAAAEVGMLEHSPTFNAQAFAKSGKRGGVDANGVSANKRALIQDAANKAGIPAYVLYGLYGAESNFGTNPGNSSAGAQGPFQFMPATARSYGVKDVQNFTEMVYAAAKYLGKYKNRGIRGMLAAYNAGPAGNPNNAETRAYIPKVLKLGGQFVNPGGKGKDVVLPDGSPVEVVEKPTYGASSSFTDRIAAAEGRLSTAGRSTKGPQAILDAIAGSVKTVKKSPARMRNDRKRANAIGRKMVKDMAPSASAQTSIDALNEGTYNIHTEGMLDVLREDEKRRTGRLGKIDKALKGKLTKDTRNRLLEERTGLLRDRTAGTERRAELQKQYAEARFERGAPGGGAAGLAAGNIAAEATKGLDDDIALAQKEREYYMAKARFSQGRGDAAATNEAMAAFNQATQRMEQAVNARAENRLSAGSAEAELTTTLSDDLAWAQQAEGYWEARLALAHSMGDSAGVASAAQSLKGARDNIKAISDRITMMPMELASVAASLTLSLTDDVAAAQDLVNFWTAAYNAATGADKITAGQSLAGAQGTLRDAASAAELLPLQRDQAMAALTEDINDDKAANERIRDYWQHRLNDAISTGDVRAQIEAAQALKQADDAVKEGANSINDQIKVLDESRRTLFREFGSNFITTPVPMVSPTVSAQVQPQVSSFPGDQTKNVTLINNFQEPPADPHTWSKNVAWELQTSV